MKVPDSSPPAPAAPPAARPRRRRWRRLLLGAAGLALAALAWLLFFPVPLGWAVRRALQRTFPASAGWRTTVGAAEFRWRFGQPAGLVTIAGLQVAQGEQPLLAWRELDVELSKRGLWQRRYAPTLVTLQSPVATVDLRPPAQPAPMQAARPAPASSGPAPAPDIAGLLALLPADGAAARLVVEDLRVQVRFAAGDTAVLLPRMEASLAGTPEKSVRAELAMVLGQGASAPHLQAGLTLSSAGRAEFSASAPRFSTTDLPAIPGQPLPLRAAIAFNVTGTYDLKSGRLLAAAGGVQVNDAELRLPSFAAPVDIALVDLQGRANLDDGRMVLEKGRVQALGATLDISRLEAVLGNRPRLDWQAKLTSVKGAKLRPLLPEAMRASLPVPAERLDDLEMAEATTQGQADLAPGVNGAWTVEAVDAVAHVDIRLGNEPVVGDFSARRKAGEAMVAVTADLPSVRPGRWPAPLLASTPGAGFDVPLALKAAATLTPAGAPQTVRLEIEGGAGQLPALQPNLPMPALQSFRARLESENVAARWRIPELRLVLADGPELVLRGADLGFSPAELTAKGALELANLTGGWAGRWIPPEIVQQMAQYGVTPVQLALPRVQLDFQAGAVRSNAGAWAPRTLEAKGEIEANVQSLPLKLSIQVAKGAGSEDLTGKIDVAEFRPAALKLTLPGGWTPAALDFPIRLGATVRASVAGGPSAADLQLSLGPGRLRAVPLKLDLPVEKVTLDAGYDFKRAIAEVRSADISAGGVRVQLRDVSSTAVPPFQTKGKMSVAAFALGSVMANWTGALDPELRKLAQDMLQKGDFKGADLEWEAAFDPSAKTAAWKIGRVKGSGGFSGLTVAAAGVPTPVQVREVTTAFDYPHATAELRGISGAGAEVSSVQLEAVELDHSAPLLTAAVRFESDLKQAAALWALPPGLTYAGRVAGQLDLRGRLGEGAIEARLAADLAKAAIAAPGIANLAPESLAATLRLKDWHTATTVPELDFSFDSPRWLEAPLHLQGQVILDAASRQLRDFELSRFEHGGTALQASVKQSSPDKLELKVDAARIEMAPWMRAALAWMDGQAKPAPPIAPPAKAVAGSGPAKTSAPVRPVAAPAAAPALPSSSIPGTPPRPAVVTAEVRSKEIVFGDKATVRDFQFKAELVNQQPSAVTLEGMADGNNVLRATLAGKSDGQVMDLEIGDAPGWIKTLLAPWGQTPALPGTYGATIAQLGKVPAIVAGGRITAHATVHPGAADWFEGDFRLTHTTMIHPPRILQLLALKSGKAAQGTPLIDELALGKITLSTTQLRMTGFSLKGAGFVNNLKLGKASYALADEAIEVDGQYFGIGFEVSGTRSSPQVYLKETALIRAIGQRNEFDFDDPPAKK